MPIPKPHDGEEEGAFVSRCMADDVMQEYDQDQRTAICYQAFKDKDKEQATEELSEVKDGLIRIAVAYTGDFERGGKPFKITSQDLKDIMRNMKGREVPLDYEHLSAKPDAPPGHSRASGWLKASDKIEKFANNKEILWAWAELTPAALAAVRNKEFRYFSPEIHWNAEDEKGKDVGTRLAAGAITNRPFLKDLPPISVSAEDYPTLLEAVALSELKRLNIDVGDVHVTSDINSNERKNAMKKLTIKPIPSGDQKGKPGVFDGDEQIGMAAGLDEMHADELEELRRLKKTKASEYDAMQASMAELKAKLEANTGELEELRGLKASMTAQASELAELRQLKARAAKGGDLYIKHEGDDNDGDETAGLKKLVEDHRKRQAAVACLTEFAKTDPGEKTMLLAEDMLASGKLSMIGYLQSQKIERLLDGAIKKGKLLPKQRQSMYMLAVADYASAEALLKEAQPVVDTKIHGFEGEGEGGVRASQELDALIAAYMTENKGSNRADALLYVTRKNPELWEQHKRESVILHE